MREEFKNLISKIHDKNAPKVLVAAPMAGISNRPFRRFMKRYGSEFSVSELVSAKGLIFGGQKTLELIRMCDEERPVGIQLFGEDVESMVEGAKIVEAHGADFVDINFGCPVPKVVKRGAGAGWLRKDLKEFGGLLEAMVKAVSIPVSIKVRTGWDSDSRNAHDITRVAYESGILWVAIHGRTRTQGYSGLADWDYLNDVARNSKIPIFGNGDILTKSDLLKRSFTFEGRGLMVGRGILHDPLLLCDKENTDFYELFMEYVDLVLEDFNEAFSLSLLKKMAAWITSGMPNGNHFRRNIFCQKSLPDLLGICEEYLKGKSSAARVETANLLMGGHG